MTLVKCSDWTVQCDCELGGFEPSDTCLSRNLIGSKNFNLQSQCMVHYERSVTLYIFGETQRGPRKVVACVDVARLLASEFPHWEFQRDTYNNTILQLRVKFRLCSVTSICLKYSWYQYRPNTYIFLFCAPWKSNIIITFLAFYVPIYQFYLENQLRLRFHIIILFTYFIVCLFCCGS